MSLRSGSSSQRKMGITSDSCTILPSLNPSIYTSGTSAKDIIEGPPHVPAFVHFAYQGDSLEV